MDENLNRLAEAAGIEPRFWDIHGVQHETSDVTKRALLAAFGAFGATAARTVLPPVFVLYDQGGTEIPLALSAGERTLAWSVRLEDGGLRRGEVRQSALAVLGRDGDHIHYRLNLPKLPLGYHDLTLEGLEVGDGGPAVMRLIVSPGAGWLPPEFTGRKLTGISTQLYSLRSPEDWGIGDFGHLTRLVDATAGAGCDAIGLNPLHALFPDSPADASPYSPASRLFRNPYYIDVTAVPEFASSTTVAELMHTSVISAALQSAQGGDVDYLAVAAAKRTVLEQLFTEFCAAPKDGRYAAFREYVDSQGEALTDFAAFQALSEHFGTHDWGRWPQECQDPHAPETRTLCAQLADRMAYFEYLQWLCEVQFHAASRVAAARGMAVGLYNDMAVSVNRASADCWCHQDLFAHGLSIGSPPDPFNMAGQEWGVVPMNPARMRASGYAHFIALLRANMRHAGALRIDHVMGWLRLFLIPVGGKPADGAYVRYPADDLFAIATLESHRNRCLLIGEDLGTVPDGYRERMAATHMLSCRVLYFEREGSGFRAPQHYPELAVASVSTHDLPTLRGYFDAVDIDTRARIGEYANAEAESAARRERGEEKRTLLHQIRDAGLLPDGVNADDPATGWSDALALAVQLYLAQAPSKLMLCQLDDLTGVARQTNLPGTTWQHPNWRTRQPVAVENLASSPAINTLRAIVAARARR